MTLVSVIIPTTRRHDLVVRALDSVLGQTHGDLEVIVVVDGPNPVTVTALSRITDPRLTVIQNETAIGPGPARNRGGQLATGAFVAFLDDDDVWLPEKIATQLTVADPDHPVLVSCQTIVRTPRATYIWPRVPYDGVRSIDEYLYDRRSLVRGEAFINTSTFLLPLAVFRETGFGDSRNQEDVMLLLRVTKALGGRVVMVPQPLAVVYKEEDRESLGSGYSWRDMLIWAEAAYGFLSPRAYSGFCLIYLGSKAAESLDFAGFRVLFFEAIRKGRPTFLQLCLFASYWIFPRTLRIEFRALLSGIRRIGAPGSAGSDPV